MQSNPTTQNPNFRPMLEGETLAGTSFHDHILIPCTPNEIIKVLGEPAFRHEDKIEWEWNNALTLKGRKPILFTVYDYKTYQDIGDDEVFPDWHIGGLTFEDTKIVSHEINKAIKQNRN